MEEKILSSGKNGPNTISKHPSAAILLKNSVLSSYYFVENFI